MFKQTKISTDKAFPVIYASDFSVWKKPIVRHFFAGSNVVFVCNVSNLPTDATLAVWGCKPISGNLPAGIRLIHLEDGFLRSIGLGADLIRPVSWVIDTRGIYYDATRPSDLEVLLQTNEFTTDLLTRAIKFRERVVSTGLTKYNVGNTDWQRPATAGHVILVPGQVENDASLRFGAPGIRSNLALLKVVRKANPDAYVIYKPHPDVMAGLKARGEAEAEAVEWCDEIIEDVPMGELLSSVDAVHVLTSLAGFEALLRGKAVTCYGQPFYAGWGLTEDILPVSRRTRLLTLDQLVAGALILYPSYVSSITGESSTPEQALDDLLAWRKRSPPGVPTWRKSLRRLLIRAVS